MNGSNGIDEYSRLTPCEKDVLRRAAEGKTNMESVRCLYLSINTVKKYRASLMDKLGLRHRSDLIRYALRGAWLATRTRECSRSSGFESAHPK
ncbi:MAG: DNA-binding response regulator [Dehalococcoidia bacterium]|nr:DNA-binding response regulator [Dehalococcoidia bacterium]